MLVEARASSRPPSRPTHDNELDELAFLTSFKLRRVKDGKNLTAMVRDAITEAELEMTIEGAGTLTLTINDPDWVILTSGVFDLNVKKKLDRIDVKVDHRWYRLVQVQAQGSTLTLTCEEREVAYLRAHRKLPGKGKWSRSDHTRAEFVQHLVRQVKAGGGIDMLIYELHKKQPIEPVRADDTTTTDDSNDDSSSTSDPFDDKRKIGKFDSSAYGPPWNAMNGSGVTSRRVDLRPAKKKYGIAIDPDYKLDYDKNYYIWPNPFNHKGTFVAFDTGGAITGNRIDFYDWRGRKEQMAWGRKDVTVYKASGSADPGDGSDPTTTTRRQRYEYKVEAGERFWDTIQRLAQEPVIDADTGEENPLGWRGFMQNYRKKNGKLGVRFVFAAEEDLLSRGRKLTIHREGANVTDFSFDWDQGKKVAEAQLQLLMDRWAVDPGEVIAIRDAGPASGNWLVTNIRRSLFSPTADITLKQPMPEQKEPAPQTTTVTDEDSEVASPGGDVSDAVYGSPIPGQKPHSATHQTAGLAGYPAYDYMAPAGTPVVAPESGKVTKLSGHNPKTDHPSAGGAHGYSIYITGKSGTSYFLTHLDKRNVKVGDKVKQGHQIAEVADGPKSWSSPHCHMGVNRGAPMPTATGDF